MTRDIQVPSLFVGQWYNYAARDGEQGYLGRVDTNAKTFVAEGSEVYDDCHRNGQQDYESPEQTPVTSVTRARTDL